MDRRAVFWADRDEPDDYLFVSAQSLWVYGGYDFSRAFQGAVPDDIRDQLSAKTTLVHLTDHPERIGEHLKLLDAHGVRYGNQRQWTVRSGQSLFYMAAEDIVDISGIVCSAVNALIGRRQCSASVFRTLLSRGRWRRLPAANP